MPEWIHSTAALTVAIALAAGMTALSIAHHLRMPGIVLLLAVGVLLGPDVVGVVLPESLGPGLEALVGLAVAVILFEGGLSLQLHRIRREQKAIRRLLTLGAAISLALGTAAAWLVLDLDPSLALLFGTLVVVTGPTVITPLVRRWRLRSDVATVLETEGVLIDAVGAIAAAVALEIVLRPSGQDLALAVPAIAVRLGFGAVVGAVMGGALAIALGWQGLIPEGRANVVTLALAVLTFELSNALVDESGVAAVIVAGAIVGNAETRVHRELAEFKEQLTALFIGMLFVLLAADVRIADVVALGLPGVLVAALIIVVVRPASVLIATVRSGLEPRARLFVACVGPRGIVAAAVASFCAYELQAAGMEGGPTLRALVFLVIAATVVWSALTGGRVAAMLGLSRRRDAGWLVVGGSEVARTLAKTLQETGAEVVIVDKDQESTRAAEAAGLRVIFGNALERSTLARAELDTRCGIVGITQSPEINFLVARKARAEVRYLRYVVGLTSFERDVTPEMVDEAASDVLGGAAIDIAAWARRLEKATARVVWWRFRGGRKRPSLLKGSDESAPYFPLVHKRGRRLGEPVGNDTRFRRGSEVALLVDVTREGEVSTTLEAAGWSPCAR